MKNHINLVYTFLRIGILDELQYRANFFIQLLQTAFQLTVSLGGLAVVFQHTDDLGGWQAMELVALLGIYFMMRGAIYTIVSPSLELFMQDVRMGTLDYTLIKPVDAQFLVSIRRVSIWRLTTS